MHTHLGCLISPWPCALHAIIRPRQRGIEASPRPAHPCAPCALVDSGNGAARNTAGAVAQLHFISLAQPERLDCMLRLVTLNHVRWRAVHIRWRGASGRWQQWLKSVETVPPGGRASLPCAHEVIEWMRLRQNLRQEIEVSSPKTHSFNKSVAWMQQCDRERCTGMLASPVTVGSARPHHQSRSAVRAAAHGVHAAQPRHAPSGA
eukprot:358772-Chlamydomonas_euryale.AAC.12